MDLFRFVPGYETSIYEAGREPIFVTLLAFLITFVLTRAYTRLARSRGWGSGHVGDVHIHHMVVGILLVLGSGILLIGFFPDEGFWQLLLCAAFGSGAAFVLDEFALVFRLKDVYWSEEGRSSVDAVVIALVVGALVLLHAVPFSDETAEDASRWTIVAIVSIHVSLVVVALLKGKLMLGLIGVFVPFVALVAAARLAKPSSPWAHKFYPHESHRDLRSRKRYERYDRWVVFRRKEVEDLIAGAPSAPETD